MSETKNNSTAPKGEETAGTAEEKPKLSRKKLIIIISAIAAVVIAAVVLTAVFAGGSADSEDEDDIQYIDVSATNYYGGIVEPQQTSDINKDPERTVSEVYVKVGDTVRKGDKLFEYDSNETATKLSKAKIEYEGIQNDITECDNRISQLSVQRSEADENQQLDYTTQIQEQQSTKSQLQLNLKIKQVEIDNLQDNLNNSVVTSPIDGIIKQINNGENASGAYMTVLMNGSYRIKGKVDEMNVRSLSAGMDVIVHSRIDSEKTWNGTISKVDTGTSADSGDNNSMNNSGDSSTKYYFYASLESSDGLLLGEHVYIEPVFDNGFDSEDIQPDDAADAAADAAEN